MTDPYGRGSWAPPGRPAPRGSRRRRPRWVTVGLPVLLAGVALVVAAQFVVDGRRDAQLRPSATPLTGSVVPAPELVGEWSGQGTLARCAGYDQGCPATRSVTVTIACSAAPCAVTPFDRRYGSPPFEVEGGSYQAAGPVPPDVAPTCGGVPASTALWRLDLTVRGGRLVGTYAESTLQGFDCGGTGVTWSLTLDRSGG